MDFKRFTTYAAVLLSTLIWGTSAACAQGNGGEYDFVGRHGQLSVAGTSLVDKNGEVLQLKGVSLGWHNWWPRFYDAATIYWLRYDWNCRVVRAAIGVDPENGYIQNPQFALQCLYNVVDAAIDNDMYVIIDWHAHNIRTEKAKEFFTVVAAKYKDYPNIIYEIYNEPEGVSWADVKTYSEEVIKTIRAIDPDHVILVGNPHWDQDVHLVADDPLVGYKNIMYTLHFYAATHRQFLRDRADYALQKGIPLFVSECAGMEASGDSNIDIAESLVWRDWMDSHKISWAAWSISDKDETCSMIKSSRSPISGWTDDDLKEWGKIVRNTLRNE